MYVGKLQNRHHVETCLILGQVSHVSVNSKKKFLTDICGPVRDPELWKSMGKHAKVKEKHKVFRRKDSS